MSGNAAPSWLVVCLCAQWCDVCKLYQPAYEALAAQLPGVRFAWVDVEDDEEALGELDIETFPTLLIGQGDGAVFLGPLLPQIGVLQRMVENFTGQAADPLPAGHEAHALLERVHRLLVERG
ncbi:MAG: thioredoxin family protein [Comamonas sp.]